MKELKSLREKSAEKKLATLTKELQMQEKKRGKNVVPMQQIVRIELMPKLKNLKQNMKLQLKHSKMPIKMNLPSFKTK